MQTEGVEQVAQFIKGMKETSHSHKLVIVFSLYPVMVEHVRQV